MNFEVLPSPSPIDWEIVAYHERLHAVLATSTTVGFLHQVLAYLDGYGVPRYRGHWANLLRVAVERSRTTHEATATYVSLMCAAERIGDTDATLARLDQRDPL